MIQAPGTTMRAATTSIAVKSALSVGVVTTSFPVTKESVSGVFIERLVSALPADIAVTVLTPAPDSKPPLSGNDSYKLVCFRYGPWKWQRLSHQPGGLPAALKRRDPSILLLPFFLVSMFLACLRLAGKVDILHANWSISGLISALAARLRGRPALVTLRGSDVNKTIHSLRGRLILRFCLMLNQRTVVVSKSMREELAAHFPAFADRLLFIPNGVSIDESARPRRRKPVKLITVGSLVAGKRVEVLLQGLARIKRSDEVKLLIIGDGPERSALITEAKRLAIEKQVEFVGAVPPREIERYLRAADIFVFASESEGRPNVVLEAMAAGLPIISSDIPGVRELLGEEAGLLYPVGDRNALAACIEKLIQDPHGSQRLGELARELLVARGLSWTICAQKYLELYQAMRERSVRRPCAE